MFLTLGEFIAVHFLAYLEVTVARRQHSLLLAWTVPAASRFQAPCSELHCPVKVTSFELTNRIFPTSLFQLSHLHCRHILTGHTVQQSCTSKPQTFVYWSCKVHDTSLSKRPHFWRSTIKCRNRTHPNRQLVQPFSIHYDLNRKMIADRLHPASKQVNISRPKWRSNPWVIRALQTIISRLRFHFERHELKKKTEHKIAWQTQVTDKSPRILITRTTKN